MKHLKVPTGLTQPPFNSNSLNVNDFSAIESCVHTRNGIGSMCLEEHMLLFVLDGTNTLTHGKQTYVVRKNEMILLKKATVWGYDKKGNPDNDNIYDSMLFFLKDEFLKDFVKMANIKIIRTNESVITTVKPVKECLQAYVNSIKPYFNDPKTIDAGLLRLKMMELLYDLAIADKNLLQQILQLRQPAKTDITSIVEQNYTNPISLSELAYLSGRSLSSFKRDFLTAYNTSPSDWIREKRLGKAQELLSNTSMSVADVCYLSGFENVTHFSRIFKERFGYSPSERKTQINS